MYLEDIVFNEKGRVEEICPVPSVESEEICDSVFSLENSKFRTSITKVYVLEVLWPMFSFAIEIPAVKEKQSLWQKCSVQVLMVLRPWIDQGCNRYLL